MDNIYKNDCRCPFCGAIISGIFNSSFGEFTFECEGEECSWTCSVEALNREDALDKWNDRPSSKVAIFYDRKHLCEVSANQLMGTNVVATLARTQDDQDIDPTREGHSITGTHELCIGELGYKSLNCPKGVNFDRWLMLSDLVFLRFE